MLDRFLDHLRLGSHVGTAGMVLGVVLLGLLQTVLPRGDRRRARLPLLLLATHVAVAGLRALAHGADALEKPLGILGTFLLWAGVGQAAFVLVIDGVLGRRLAWPMPRIFRDILQLALYFLVALGTLSAAGVQPSSLIAGSALVTAVIGLSLQDTLGNLFAGLAIQAQRPFEVGDWVQLGEGPDPLGRVTEINWRATKVLTNDRIEVVVPNANLARAPIRNFSKPTGLLRRSVVVTAAYGFSPQHVREVLMACVRDTPGVLADPAPSVIVQEFDPDGVRYALRFFVEEAEHVHPLDSAVRERIWYAFRRNGIGIPFPQRVVEVRHTEDDAALRAARIDRHLASLRRVDLLAALPEPHLRELAGLLQTRRYAPDEIVLRRGEAGDELFIIEHGEVAVMNDAVEVARLGKGMFFGEMSLMTGAKRTATVRATRDCALLVVDKASFQQVLHAEPSLAERISAILATRQEQLQEASVRESGVFRRETDKGSAILARIKEFFAL